MKTRNELSLKDKATLALAAAGIYFGTFVLCKLTKLQEKRKGGN